MTSEPPSKRCRRGQSPMDDWEDEEDDDELFFQSLDVEAERDSGYKLSIERAYSNHRFQATMAHIFDKYGRDFDGIGDEIDLMTGKIVVDNGHIHRMRNEGDVGDEKLQDEEHEEDEGILLEDLTDGEGDDFRQDQGNAEDESDGESSQQGREDEVQDQSPNSMALVARRGTEAPADAWPKQPPGMLPNLSWRNPYGAVPYGLDTLPLLYGPSPFAYGGAPPFSAAPWDNRAPPYSEWVHLQAQAQRSAYAGHRYNFKAQQGRSSIWARRSKFKDDEDEPLRSVFDLALSKHLAKGQAKDRKSLPAPPGHEQQPSEDEDDDDEAILSGKPTMRERRGETAGSVENDSEDEIDGQEALSSDPTRSRQRKESRQSQAQGGEAHEEHGAVQPKKRGRKRKRRPTNVAATECDDSEAEHITTNSDFGSEAEAQYKIPQPDRYQSSDETSHVRRSSRARKQVDSYAEVQERGSQTISIDLPSVNPHSRDEYQAIEVAEGSEGESHAPHEGSEYAPSIRMEDAHEAAEEGLPDLARSSSQDSHVFGEIPGGASSRRPYTPDPTKAKTSKIPLKDVDSACVLSDEEIAVSKAEDSERTGRARHRRTYSTRPKARSVTPAVRSIADTGDEDETDEDAKELRSPSSSIGKVNDDGPSYAAIPFSSSPTRSLARFTSKASLNNTPTGLLKQVRKLRHEAATPSPSPSSETSSPITSERRGPGRPRKSIGAADKPPLPEEPAEARPPPDPKTPRHRHPAPSKTPSSRRSILSMLPGREDGEMDELGRNLASMPLHSSGSRSAVARRIWKSSALTREVYHTPVKKRARDPVSPGSLIRTPGGSVRACGLDGYRCGRDFCFACL